MTALALIASALLTYASAEADRRPRAGDDRWTDLVATWDRRAAKRRARARRKS